MVQIVTRSYLAAHFTRARVQQESGRDKKVRYFDARQEKNLLSKSFAGYEYLFDTCLALLHAVTKICTHQKLNVS